MAFFSSLIYTYDPYRYFSVSVGQKKLFEVIPAVYSDSVEDDRRKVIDHLLFPLTKEKIIDNYSVKVRLKRFKEILSEMSLCINLKLRLLESINEQDLEDDTWITFEFNVDLHKLL